MAAPISAPFFPPMSAPTPAPEAAEPPMIISVFCQVRCGAGSRYTTRSLRTGAALVETLRRTGAGRVTDGELTSCGRAVLTNCDAGAYWPSAVCTSVGVGLV